jgi:mannosyltransferase OCH1-like enzyme
MTRFKEWMINIDKMDNDAMWDILDEKFEKNYIENNYENKIPKKIHQVWLGGKFPEKYKRIRDTWIEKNPDWEYKLWTDDDIDEFKLENIEQFNKINNLGAKSDIFRYEILYRYGGLYIDTDFECLKSFNDLTYLDFFTGTGHKIEPEVFNGLIACTPRHNLIRKMIDGIKVVETNNFDKIMALTGPLYFSSVFFEYVKNTDERIVVFPTTFFYPLPAIFRHSVREDNNESRDIVKRFLTDKSYCVHLWYTSWQK